MATRVLVCLLLTLLISPVFSASLHREDAPLHSPLGSVSDLTSHVGLHARDDGPRLPVPLPGSVDAIKKVAQILIMLGEQVIPAIIGDPGEGGIGEVSPDEVHDK